MNTELTFVVDQIKELDDELHSLEVDTFEIEDVVDPGQDALLIAFTSSSTSSTSCA